MEGEERRAAFKLWRKFSESAARVSLLRVLSKEGVALQELEKFNLGLKNKFRSKKFKSSADKLTRSDGKFLSQAMKLKLADKQEYLRELFQEKTRIRREIAKKHKTKSKPYRKIMTQLRQEAKKRKEEMTRKFMKKVEHIKHKYSYSCRQEDENKKVPEDMLKFSDCSIFDKKKYDDLEEETYEIKVIGEVDLSENEKKVLKPHPKFCVVGHLEEVHFEQEIEAALTKLRMEYRKQEENRELTQEEIEESEEFEARSRLVFHPEDKNYDARRR